MFYNFGGIGSVVSRQCNKILFKGLRFFGFFVVQNDEEGTSRNFTDRHKYQPKMYNVGNYGDSRQEPKNIIRIDKLG